MKSTGIVRKVDELGRIVLPIELRRTLGIEVKDSLEIFVEGSEIILKKYDNSCIFCTSTENVVVYSDRTICKKCIGNFVCSVKGYYVRLGCETEHRNED